MNMNISTITVFHLSETESLWHQNVVTRPPEHTSDLRGPHEYIQTDMKTIVGQEDFYKVE